MTQPEDATTSTMDLLKEMKEQMATLTSKVETLQQKQASDASLMVQEEEDNEDDELSRSLVSLLESTHAFLEAAFSTTLTNADRKKRVDKAALSILRDDIQKAAGSFQLCAGQVAGVEAAVHRVRSAFLHEDTDAILLADASNAFNSLNRAVALHNIQQICPSFAPLLINTYRSAAGLFIAGDVLFSEEGTIQGDPLAMPMYALATLPLIKRISGGVTQVWYADDACACGSISQL